LNWDFKTWQQQQQQQQIKEHKKNKKKNGFKNIVLDLLKILKT